MDKEKVFKLCQKFVLLIKQVIYEVSIQQATHIAAYSVATQNQTFAEQPDKFGDGKDASRKRVKTLVFSFSSGSAVSEKEKELRAAIIA